MASPDSAKPAAGGDGKDALIAELVAGIEQAENEIRALMKQVASLANSTRGQAAP
jgi:hypothetical protein